MDEKYLWGIFQVMIVEAPRVYLLSFIVATHDNSIYHIFPWWFSFSFPDLIWLVLYQKNTLLYIFR